MVSDEPITDAERDLAEIDRFEDGVDSPAAPCGSPDRRSAGRQPVYDEPICLSSDT